MNIDNGICEEDGVVITGNYNRVNGSNCIVRGDHNIINGNKCRIQGDNNVINGNECVYQGFKNKVKGQKCVWRKPKRTRPPSTQIQQKKKKAKTATEKNVKIPSFASVELDTEAPDDGDSRCCVCLTNLPCCIILPCGHKCICAGCGITLGSDKLRSQCACPHCREEVKEIKRVFE